MYAHHLAVGCVRVRSRLVIAGVHTAWLRCSLASVYAVCGCACVYV